MTELHVVTGTFSYTGKYITKRLLERGIQVKSLTNHPNRPSPFDQPVETAPLDFRDPERLTESLRGASVRRIVHVSIANPDPASPLPYYSGKGRLEQSLQSLGPSYAILRPTVIFGEEDILINNIAWLLRRFPVFGVPGSGTYRIQPIFVEEFARLAVDAGSRTDSFILNAVGPETFTFTELVQMLARTVRSRARMIHLPPAVATEPTGRVRLTDWLREHAGDPPRPGWRMMP